MKDKTTLNIISFSILIGLVVWIIDGIVDHFIFTPWRGSLLDSIILNLTNHNIFTRTLFIIACLIGGLLVSGFLRRQRESEQMLSQAVEGNSLPTFIIDKKHTVTHWNRACERLTGVSMSDMIGTKKQWSPFYSAERPVLADLVMGNPTDELFEKYYHNKFKESALVKGAYEAEDFFTGLGDKWLFFTAAPLRDSGGKVIGAIEIHHDITGRKRSEKELQERMNELEAKTAEMERFTYTVSHDLKSPLITIKGFLGLLLEDAEAGNTERLRDDVGRISKAAERMHQLLNELLELSRIGYQLKLHEQVSMSELAMEAVKMFSGRNELGVKIETAGILPVVYGDRNRLLEVFENLIDNSIKFMGNQPDPRIDIGMRYDNREQVFYVRDNGTGIDTRYQKKVFGLFDKLNQNSDGTGVGLAIVKRIVEVHGGRVWVESKGDRHGSTFCFTLPDGNKSKDKGNFQET